VTDEGKYIPKNNPHAKRYVHLDPGKTGDAFALAIVHCAGLIKVRKDGSDIAEYQPVFMVDFMLRIKGSREQEVLFRNVRRLLYDFADRGFHFACISMDGYQTTEMHQGLESVGYRAEYLSVDKSKEPYIFLRRSIYEKRISYYNHPVFLQELKRLEDVGDMIDHPPGGSKDLADAVCGAVTKCSSELTYTETIIEKGEFIESGDATQNEQFEAEVQNNLQPIAAKKYVKQPKKNLEPTYKKEGQDSSSRILDVIDCG
jgi:hypothetical protein